MTSASAAAVTGPRLWRGLALVSLAGVLWGTIGPGVHLVHEMSGFSPPLISAYRALVAVVALLLAAAATGRLTASWRLARGQWRRVIVVGLLTAAFQVLFFVAVVAIGVSVATVVCLGFAPVLLLVLGSLQRRRRPSSASMVTVFTAVAGVLLLSVGGGAGAGANPVLGVLAALGSGAAYALSAVVAGPLSQRLDTLTVTIATMTVAAAVLVPGGLLLAVARGEGLSTRAMEPWLLIVYLGVVTMAVAYALLYTGLRDTPSGSAVVATLLEPVTAVLIAVLLLGEQLTLTGGVGALLILVAIVSLGRGHETHPPAQ